MCEKSKPWRGYFGRKKMKIASIFYIIVSTNQKRACGGGSLVLLLRYSLRLSHPLNDLDHGGEERLHI